ncbi:arpa protein [Leptolyngbya sp. Heron Island J]|uniref:HalD/BesD family halogenase n=1 Tax=Leptolyngbya sp. Heron Island J TaxID=1385935 RepID=UPI0003B9F4C3|nr:hypothetical protein [Leptolyngbya sp. Heron Island J]ESA32707.1 arpa protein [Leptolyngbya sp. Heron Island J]
MADIITETLNVGSQQQVESLLKKYFSKKNLNSKQKIEQLFQEFRSCHYVCLKEFIPLVLQTGARGETSELLNHFSSNVSVTDASTNKAPLIAQVSQLDIEHRSIIIPALYYSQSLRQLLLLITANEVIPYSSKHGGISITHVNEADYYENWQCVEHAYQLVWFIEAPKVDAGGAFEFIKRSTDQDLSINHDISENQIQRRYHKSRDVFLLKADACLQRFAPFNQGAERVVITMNFANGPRLGKI